MIQNKTIAKCKKIEVRRPLDLRKQRQRSLQNTVTVQVPEQKNIKYFDNI